MNEQSGASIVCWQCKALVGASERMCPNCNSLIHREQLEKLANAAAPLEQSDPAKAFQYWTMALNLLPPGSEQAQYVNGRLAELSARTGASASSNQPAQLAYGVSETSNDTWPMIILKTGGSAVLSAWFLSTIGGWWFAAGMILLILIHELGHSLANLYYGLRASPPIFLGPLGAIIYLRDPPPNAKVESVIGIAGPVLGTVAALGMFAYWKFSGNELAQILSWFGFWLNLFNLIPLPPLDGGRAVAAVSPRIWPVGIAGLIGYAIYRYTHHQLGDISIFLFVYILMSAWPRVAMTLKYLPQLKEYFTVPTSFRVGMALLHGGLALGLYLLMRYTDPA